MPCNWRQRNCSALQCCRAVKLRSGPFGVIAGVFGAMVAYEVVSTRARLALPVMTCALQPMATQFGADIGLLVSVGFGYLLGQDGLRESRNHSTA